VIYFADREIDMIRQWWQKVRFGRKAESGNLAVQDTSVGDNSNAVVPLRRNMDTGALAKRDSAEVFQEAVDKLVDKLEQINAGISLRVQQNEQLLDKMNQLPDFLAGLPQHTQQQREILQELVAEIKAKSAGEQKMLDAVVDMTEQSVDQTRKLGSINEQLQSSAKTDRQMCDNMGRFGDSLSRLSADTNTQTEWMQHLTRAIDATDQYVKLTLARQQNRFMWVFAISMAVSVVAIMGLVLGIWLFNR
jgi:Mg2+ and Co2+ transporter CorA